MDNKKQCVFCGKYFSRKEITDHISTCIMKKDKPNKLRYPKELDEVKKF